jgi:hypothetical protein
MNRESQLRAVAEVDETLLRHAFVPVAQPGDALLWCNGGRGIGFGSGLSRRSRRGRLRARELSPMLFGGNVDAP